MELAVVVAILGLVAAVAMPNFAATDVKSVELAATEVADAVRFARNEAIRTGMPHGIFTDAFSDRVRVYSMPGSTPIYDVRHPVDKKLYDIQFNSNSNLVGVDLVSALYNFDGIFPSIFNFGFNSHGIPKFSFFGTDYMLADGTITLSHGDHQRVVSIAPMTGRVTIQ